jgi:hypothetical protein
MHIYLRTKYKYLTELLIKKVGGSLMIGLEFVKSVDKEWKNSIKFADGSPYYDDYCPLSGARCKRDDCSFWDTPSNLCKYLK